MEGYKIWQQVVNIASIKISVKSLSRYRRKVNKILHVKTHTNETFCSHLIFSQYGWLVYSNFQQSLFLSLNGKYLGSKYTSLYESSPFGIIFYWTNLTIK